MDTSDLAIRVARFPPTDSDLHVVALARALHREQLDPTAREFPAEGTRVPYTVIAALSADRAIAYASYEDLQELYDLWWVKWVLVDRDHRRSGIGTSLLHEVGEAAMQAGVGQVCLEPWAEGDDAEPWYLRLGFEWIEDEDSAPSRYLSVDPALLVASTTT